MTCNPPQYRWTRDGFLRAHEAGAFEGRVELVDGEVWPVVIGNWHGDLMMRLVRQFPETDDARLQGSSLTPGESLLDPDCWVRRRSAHPAGELTRWLSIWDPADVLLVVEISDDSLQSDLTTKATIYGSAGYPTYWVISPDAVYVHTEPISRGYRVRKTYKRGDRIPVPYADAELSIDDILADSDD